MKMVKSKLSGVCLGAAIGFPALSYAGSLYQTDYSYNAMGLPIGIVNSNAANKHIVSQFHYTDNANAEVSTLQSTSTDASQSAKYVYDSLGHLISDNESTGTTQYQFDLESNLRVETTPQGIVNRHYNSANQLIAIDSANQNLTINYDAFGSGNLVSNSKNEAFAYNALNELTQYTDSQNQATTYRYDANGERLSKQNQLGMQSFYYVGMDLMNSLDPKQTQMTHYLFGQNRESFIYSNQTPQIYFYNLHGDVMQLMDNAGSVAQKYNYDIYGNGSSNSQDHNPIRYAGYFYDPESNQDFANDREYNPTLQIFDQVDSVGDLTTLNDYAYVGGDSVNYIDSTGDAKQAILSSVVPGVAVGILFFGTGYKYYQYKKQSNLVGRRPSRLYDVSEDNQQLELEALVEAIANLNAEDFDAFVKHVSGDRSGPPPPGVAGLLEKLSLTFEASPSSEQYLMGTIEGIATIRMNNKANTDTNQLISDINNLTDQVSAFVVPNMGDGSDVKEKLDKLNKLANFDSGRAVEGETTNSFSATLNYRQNTRAKGKLVSGLKQCLTNEQEKRQTLTQEDWDGVTTKSVTKRIYYNGRDVVL